MLQESIGHKWPVIKMGYETIQVKKGRSEKV